MGSVATPASFRRPALSLTRNGEGISSLPELIKFNATHNLNHTFCLQAETNRPFTA